MVSYAISNTVDWENFVVQSISYGPMFYEIKTYGSFLAT